MFILEIDINSFPFFSLFPSLPKKFSHVLYFLHISFFRIFFSSIHKINNKKNRKQITSLKFSFYVLFSKLYACHVQEKQFLLLTFRNQLSLFRTFPKGKMCLTYSTSTCGTVARKLISMKVCRTQLSWIRMKAAEKATWDLAYMWFGK